MTVDLDIFDKSYEGATVVVTGHSGFKGSWLTLWLLNLNATVVGISSGVVSQPSLFEILDLDDHPRLTSYWGDIADTNLVNDVIEKYQPDFVFHLAAQPIVSISYQEPVNTLKSNILGTATVLNAMRRLSKNASLVVVTSDKCYENSEWCWGYRENDRLGGSDIYSVSKASCELVFKGFYESFFSSNQHANIYMASARAGNVIGGGDWSIDRLVVDVFRTWSRGEPVTIRNPNATRPWQHVLEPLFGYLSLAQNLMERRSKLSGHSFNFGPSEIEQKSVEQLVADLGTIWKIYVKSSCQNLVTFGPRTFNEAGLLKLACDKALNMLRWNSILGYDETIVFTAEWYAKYHTNPKEIRKFTLEQLTNYVEKARRKRL